MAYEESEFSQSRRRVRARNPVQVKPGPNRRPSLQPHRGSGGVETTVVSRKGGNRVRRSQSVVFAARGGGSGFTGLGNALSPARSAGVVRRESGRGMPSVGTAA